MPSMGCEDGRSSTSYWSVFDGVKTIPSTPEALMAEIDTAISKLQYARAAPFFDSLSGLSNMKSSSIPSPSPPRYDAQMADEAYRVGRAVLAAGMLDKALHSLNISLSKCPLDKTSAVAKLQPLISLTSQQPQKLSP